MNDVPNAILVLTRRIEKFPYCPEYADSMSKEYHSYYSATPENDLLPSDWEFTEPHEAVKRFYRDTPPPFPIEPFSDLLKRVLTGADGISRIIDCEESYFHHYGMEMCDLYWVRFWTSCAAVCRSQEEAEQFISGNADKLKEPRIVSAPFGTRLDIE